MRADFRISWLLAASLLLLTAESLANRDPFRPVEAACPPEQVFPDRWRLKGVVGQKQNYQVLLLTGKGKWAQRRQGEPVDERWYLLNIGPLSITLGDQKGCQPPVEKRLKGSLYEKDDLSAVTPLLTPFTG
ncbi:HofP DNA utilization family protein [Erwinia sp. P7711]|uniref:HofP DNA utilization family protein n=1 Tax=Erwinia sp. P7711 TaxID=3141451 RepID=UPI00318C0DC6